MAARHERTFATCERRVVDRKTHAQHRFVDLKARQSCRRLGVGERVAHFHFVDAGNDEEVTCADRLGLGTPDACELREVRDAPLEHVRLALDGLCHQGDGVAAAQRAGVYPTDGKTPEIVARIEVGDEGLQRCRRITFRCRNRVENRVQEWHEVGVCAWHADSLHRATLASNCGDDREAQVFVFVGQVEKEVFDVEQYFVGAGIAAVDFVDHEHDRQVL